MSFCAADRAWMRRALRLAVRSLGACWPNPGVGCVIVRDGVLLGGGRHERCGEAHGELRALENCRARGKDPRGATAYVSLAPCTRTGRTPPCTDALIAAGVARVVAGVADPTQDDAGGVLGAAGIAYEVGCEGALAGELHGGFLTRQRLSRPRLTGKWAMSLDGCLATDDGHSAWISSPEARALSRRRRRAFDAILVGAGTARADDPRLYSTSGDGRSPLRVVLSRGGRLPADGVLMRSARAHGLLLLHDPALDELQQARLRAAGGRLRALDGDDAAAVARALGEEGLGEVLVEGGAGVHALFLGAGLDDRLECYCAARTLGGGMPVAEGVGVARVEQGARWALEVPPRLLGDSVYLRYRRAGDAS